MTAEEVLETGSVGTKVGVEMEIQFEEESLTFEPDGRIQRWRTRSSGPGDSH